MYKLIKAELITLLLGFSEIWNDYKHNKHLN